MPPITLNDIDILRRNISEDFNLVEALKKLQAVTLAEGVWRIFSENYPPDGGIESWNNNSPWKPEWGLGKTDFLFFGEDLFGNQLVIKLNQKSAFLWNHENGELNDLFLDVPTLLENVLTQGLAWIDFYTSEVLEIARANACNLSPVCHLHWTTPLILGGRVSSSNISIVERCSHLIGHAKLWRRVGNMPHGTIVIPKRL